MGFEIVSIIVFLLAVLGIIIIILRHLPDAVEAQEQADHTSNLQEKGLPASAPSKVVSSIRFWNKRLWNYALEAKDVRPGSQVGYRLKQMVKRNKQAAQEAKPIIPPPVEAPVEIKDEAYYLDQIKHEPKNFEHYKGLGTFYLDNKQYSEAKDVFSYLADHLPGDPGVNAKLAYTHFHMKEYKDAVEFYKKSLALDSTHPNRYYNLGLCYEAIKDIPKALEALEKAINMEPENQKYLETLNRFRHIVQFQKK